MSHFTLQNIIWIEAHKNSAPDSKMLPPEESCVCFSILDTTGTSKRHGQFEVSTRIGPANCIMEIDILKWMLCPREHSLVVHRDSL
jgi:hypothetical protein